MRYTFKPIRYAATLFICWSCQSAPKDYTPFSAELLGVAIKFPMTVGKLRKTRRLDTSIPRALWEGKDSLRIEWYYDRFATEVTPSEILINDSAPIYGVAIYANNQSVEGLTKHVSDQLGVDIKPLKNTYTDSERNWIYTNDPPSWSGKPQGNVVIALRNASAAKGDFLSPSGDKAVSRNKVVRLAIGYGLTPEQEERFALDRGDIDEPVD